MAKLFQIAGEDLSDETISTALNLDKDPLALTAELLKAKEDIRDEIKQQYGDKEKDKQRSTEGSGGSGGSEETGGETGNTDGSTSTDDTAKDKVTNADSSDADSEDQLNSLVGSHVDENSGSGNQNQNPPSSDGNTEKSGSGPEGNTEDEGSVADDPSQLKSLIGSDSNPSTEELDLSKLSYKNVRLFKDLYLSYEQYRDTMSRFKMERRQLAFEEQPTVYVKESVVKALNNIIQLANRFIKHNEEFIQEKSSVLKPMMEKISAYRAYLEEGQINLNFKLVRDEEILIGLSTPKKADLRQSLHVIADFNDVTNNLVNLIVNNPFSGLAASLKNSHFDEKEGGEQFVYRDILPGFYELNAVVPPYVSYVKTDIAKYEYFITQRVSKEDLVYLDEISVTKETDFAFILDKSSEAIIGLGSLIENLYVINSNFNMLIEKIKVLIYDIEHDKKQDLATMGIDELIQNTIQFKFAVSVIEINHRISYTFLTNVLKLVQLTSSVKRAEAT